MSFNRIESSVFSGARAYFTSFDNTIVEQQNDLVSFRKQIERALKILLLTKNNVVAGASVIISSEFVYDFFKENPILLSQNMIIPALRNDKSSVGEYAERLNVPNEKKQEIANFYDARVTNVVSWELMENSNWFKDTFLKGFAEPNSVILRNLKGVNQFQIQEFVKVIENEELFDKQIVENAMLSFDKENTNFATWDKQKQGIENLLSNFSQTTKNIIRNYRELIYHISGARVVNCESNLPQENYIDYSLADMKERKTMLSELQVFWKVFLELFFETFNKPKIPIEILDLLSFEDIQKIRQPLLESGFADNYDNLVKKSINAVTENEPDKLLLSIEELFSIKQNLNFYFKEVFDKELKSFEKSKNVDSDKLLKNNFNVGLGISPIGKSLGLVESIPSSVSYLFNSAQGFSNYRALNTYDNYLVAKQDELLSMTQQLEVGQRSYLNDAIHLLISAVNEKLIV